MSFWDDVGNAISDAANAVGKAVSSVGADIGKLVDSAVQDVEHAIPDALRHYVEGVGDAVKWLSKEGNEFAGDLKKAVDLVKKIPWGDVVHSVEAAVSVVPVLGTAVSDIIATAEVAYEALTAKSPLEFAIRSAYTYAMASAPGADALRPALDPTVDALVRIAVDQEPPTSALLHAVVDEVPDSPKIVSLSPRSVAAQLAKVICAHRSIVDVGVDLAAEAAGTAGPVAERAVRAAAQAAEHGMTPAQAVQVALDIAPIGATARAAWDDVRKAVGSLGPNVLPEDLAALGAFAAPGVQQAAEKAIGSLEADGAKAVAKMIGQGRDYGHIAETMAAVDGVSKQLVDGFVAHLPANRYASAAEIEDYAQHPGLPPGEHIGIRLPAFPARLVQALVAAEPHRHITLHLTIPGLQPDPVSVLAHLLEVG